MNRLSPDDIRNSAEYELLAQVKHKKIKSFILEQLSPAGRLMSYYSVYQVLMVLLLLLMFGYSSVQAFLGEPQLLVAMACALLASFTLLVLLHEAIHAAAYRLCGIRNLRVGAIWRKFIFYVAADGEVVDYRSFRVVAWAPFVVIKLLCVAATVLLYPAVASWFFITVMAIHSLFCAGDMAMLAFYLKNGRSKLYSFDDLREGKTYFYCKR